MSYSENRKNQFEEIVNNLSSSHKTTYLHNSIVCLGDSLDVLTSIPDSSISLILTDPPYHSTKKHNIYNDKAFNCDDDFVNWIALYAKEWRRIIKPNGSLFMFCSSKMSAILEITLTKYFNMLSHVVWTKPNDPGFDGWKGKMKKEALRQWYPHSERILFAEPAENGNLKRSSFGCFLREKRMSSGLSGHQLTEITGSFGKINHGGAVSNWETGRNIPSKDQYSLICKALLDTKKIKFMPAYENIVRKFDVNKDIEFTDVWNFSSVRPYQGKHPAEKPIDMLEHCIKATTYNNDIVLDCFAGSGSTMVASENLNRFSISIEIEKNGSK